jgi:hypothetical protein
MNLTALAKLADQRDKLRIRSQEIADRFGPKYHLHEALEHQIETLDIILCEYDWDHSEHNPKNETEYYD